MSILLSHKDVAAEKRHMGEYVEDVLYIKKNAKLSIHIYFYMVLNDQKVIMWMCPRFFLKPAKLDAHMPPLCLELTTLNIHTPSSQTFFC